MGQITCHLRFTECYRPKQGTGLCSRNDILRNYKVMAGDIIKPGSYDTGNFFKGLYNIFNNGSPHLRENKTPQMGDALVKCLS
jgi:hypothetical protein